MYSTTRSTWYIDWYSFFLIIIISMCGLACIYSSTYDPLFPLSVFFKKQTIGIFLGSILYWMCTLLDYRTLMRGSYFCYFIVLGLLCFTLIKGSVGMGAQRWINLVYFKLQASELAKIFFPAFISYYFFTHEETHYGTIIHFIPLLGMLGLSFILIRMQPDLGTALIIAFSGITMLALAGLSKRFFFWSVIILLLGSPLLWNTLKPYQKKRIEVFLGYGTTQKERYQIEQAIIAVGSGGAVGKGFLNGTQNRLQFLPESRTDFIFAVLCEEWGFLGALGIIACYLFLFLRSFFMILTIKTPYAQLLAMGLLLPILFSVCINIAMVLGMLPIVGIPLPFFSYGLSNLLISFASLGWIQGIYSQQQLYIA